MKREHIYLIIIVVLFLLSGSGIFSTVHYRKENKELKTQYNESEEVIKRLQSANLNLTAKVAERDTLIKNSTAAYDTLKQSLTAVGAKIATDFPRHADVVVADINEQVRFITELIAEADGIKRRHSSLPEAEATENAKRADCITD